ncbi:MAG: tetratricopeptide repeat protein [Alphaproteobacteria bacterium]|nr:tetratricopeptide repeat protein [Alphaproteobacteria bacterium]
MIFLRPWFLLFVFVPFVFWFFKKKWVSNDSLEKFVDKRLLPYLTVRFNVGTYRVKVKRFFAFWLLLVLAGAGPAFEKVSVPVKMTAPAVILMPDLSPAMTGENLSQAKVKLYDLLNAFKDAQVGLVLYDEKGYTASPLTQDIGVVRNMIPALSPRVMPREINRPAVGLKRAQELLQNAGAEKGLIIYITAGGFDKKGLIETAKNMPYDIATLAVGDTETGYPVPLAGGDFMRDEQGNPLLVKPDKDTLSAIGTYMPAVSDGSDIKALMALLPDSAPQGNKETEGQADIWYDTGPFVLLLAIPFFLTLFRKGAFFVLLIVFSFSAEATLFERDDQEKYRRMNAGIEAYRAGNYEAARQVFESGYLADDWYNAGNARAYLNDINGAIEAYDKALKLNPNHENAAWNKAYLEKQLPPPQSQKEQNNQNDSDNQSGQSPQEPHSSKEQENPEKAQDEQGKNQEQNGQSDSSDKTQKNNNQSSDAQNDSSEVKDNQVQEAPHSVDHSEENEQSQKDMASNLQMQSEQSEYSQEEQEYQNQIQSEQEMLQEEPQDQSPYQMPSFKTSDNQGKQQQNETPQFDQESEQLLNKIKQDAGDLLRYRLLQQYRENR